MVRFTAGRGWDVGFSLPVKMKTKEARNPFILPTCPGPMKIEINVSAESFLSHLYFFSFST